MFLSAHMTCATMENNFTLVCFITPICGKCCQRYMQHVFHWLFGFNGILSFMEKLSELTVNMFEPTEEELELVEAAFAAIREGRREGLTSVASAVRGTSGAIYSSLDCRSRMSGVCAEPGAVAAAWAGEESGIVCVVAACHTPGLQDVVVISPCGACRERIHYHAPDARVIVMHEGSLWSVPARDLFPFANLFG